MGTRSQIRKNKMCVTVFGFTLIELMVTVTIIGILSSIGVIVFSRTQARARDGRRKADLSSIETALAMYASENNGEVMPDTYAGWESTSSPQDLSILVPTYIKALPVDPGSGSYLFDPNQVSGFWGYRMFATLEMSSDPDINRTQAVCSSAGLPCLAGDNYCICGP